MPEPTASVTPPLLPSERRHLETQRRELEEHYETLTRRLAALDTDIGRELDSERRLVLEDRRAELSAKRDENADRLEDVERLLMAQAPPGSTSPAGEAAAAEPSSAAPVRRLSVAFDEGHGQDRWFGAAPTVAKGFRAVAADLRQRMDVAFLPAGAPIAAQDLWAHRALVLSLGPQGQTQLTGDEQEAIWDFVRRGGGLLVLGAYTGDWHHQGNLNELLAEYGLAFNRDVVMPAGAKTTDGKLQGSERSPMSSYAVVARPAALADGRAETIVKALLAGVPAAVTLSSCSIYVDEDLAVPVLETSADSVILEPVPIGVTIHIDKYKEIGHAAATVLAASQAARVAVGGSWKMFLDAFVEDGRYANARLFRNLVEWLTG